MTACASIEIPKETGDTRFLLNGALELDLQEDYSWPNNATHAPRPTLLGDRRCPTGTPPRP
jgi:hypothetical protein